MNLTAEKILAACCEPLSLAEIARATGMNPRTVERHKNDLLSSGALERVGEGRHTRYKNPRSTHGTMTGGKMLHPRSTPGQPPVGDPRQTPGPTGVQPRFNPGSTPVDPRSEYSTYSTSLYCTEEKSSTEDKTLLGGTALPPAQPGLTPGPTGVDPRRTPGAPPVNPRSDEIEALRAELASVKLELARVVADLARVQATTQGLLSARNIRSVSARLEDAQLKADLDAAVAELLLQAREDGQVEGDGERWSMAVRKDIRAQVFAGDRAELESALRSAAARKVRALKAVAENSRRESQEARDREKAEKDREAMKSFYASQKSSAPTEKAAEF